MSVAVALKVSESKRLIARGVVASPVFREAYDRGRILIIKGTTNAYIVEELTGEPIDKLNFARGLTLPHGQRRRAVQGRDLSDVLVERGEVRWGVDIAEAVETLGRGDLILKGANALNYRERLAGVLIGDPRSGTVGLALRRAVGSHVRLMIPVGLEKCISSSIMDAVHYVQRPEHRGEGMMPVWGSIFTEIEALEVLAGVRATHIGSGGVAGAEGAIWLAYEGDEEQMKRAEAALAAVYGEPNLA
ncbi:MAG: hypothetical protein HPY83_01520 [Anaerolineae bacterium]|nr:hypothetical protein [Anaerolineae bacterium]